MKRNLNFKKYNKIVKRKSQILIIYKEKISSKIDDRAKEKLK